MAVARPGILLLLLALHLLAQPSGSSIAFGTMAQDLAVNIQPPAKVNVSGFVKTSEGPLANAQVFLFNDQLKQRAKSGDDGSFSIDVDAKDVESPNNRMWLMVFSKGMLGSIQSVDAGKDSVKKIELNKPSKPLKGRIIDHQGMNVAEAMLQILGLRHKNETIALPHDLRKDFFESSSHENGVFEFPELERDMIGQINISGKGIVSTSITGESFKDDIVAVVQPARTILGKVVDRVTNDGVSKVRVRATVGASTAEVDESGEFELTGLPAFQPLILTATPRGDAAYLTKSERVPINNGFEPINVIVKLEPGVWIRCNVKDFGSNGPARAQAYYFPTPENTEFQSFVDSFLLQGNVPSIPTNGKGNANLVGIPGPGVIAVVAQGFPPNESVNQLTDEQRAMLAGMTQRNNLTAVHWVDPKDLDDEIKLDFVVSKGRAIDIVISDNQVGPMDSLVVHRAVSKTTYSQSTKGPKFAAEQFQPGEKRRILIHSPQKKLGAAFEVEGEADSPVNVTLHPTGSLVGQIVNKEGMAQQGLLVKFEVETDDGYQEIASQVFTDVNGRFEKPSLISDLEYRVAAVRLTNQPQMMSGSPQMDSRWYVAEQLKINRGEAVDLGKITLGATDQPEPKRSPRQQMVTSENSLPSVIAGKITNQSGKPIANAMISFNTWPNRSGDISKDMQMSPTVLAQSKSGADGTFQMSIDAGLADKLINSESDGDTPNAALVVVANEMGAVQFPLSSMPDPSQLEVKLVREMVVRGNIAVEEDSNESLKLAIGDRMRVYDTESIKRVIEQLQSGLSLQEASSDVEPLRELDPLAGGIPLIWEQSSSGVFLVRGIPFNALFELNVVGSSGVQETITVISRPMRAFEIKPEKDSEESQMLQGSRIRLDIRPKEEANQ